MLSNCLSIVIHKIYFISLILKGGGDLSAMKGHKGLENIVSVIGTEFIRYKSKFERILI